MPKNKVAPASDTTTASRLRRSVYEAELLRPESVLHWEQHSRANRDLLRHVNFSMLPPTRLRRCTDSGRNKSEMPELISRR